MSTETIRVACGHTIKMSVPRGATMEQIAQWRERVKECLCVRCMTVRSSSTGRGNHD